MPTPKALKSTFGVKIGLQLSGYKLRSAEVLNCPVNRLFYYKYSSKIKFEWTLKRTPESADADTLLRLFMNFVKDPRSMTSHAGNEYTSTFLLVGTEKIEIADNGRTVILFFEGDSIRIDKALEMISGGYGIRKT